MTRHGDEPNEDHATAGGPPSRDILDAIADGVYWFDADWVLRFANEAAIEASILSRDELLGTSMRDLQRKTMTDALPPGDLLDFQRHLASGEESYSRTSGVFATSDGERPFSIRTRRVTTDSGEFAGVVMTFRDISDRVEAQSKLQRQNERLDRFASLVSHDLRNPLNVAQLSLEDLDTDDTEALARAQSAIDKMADIVEDVLALARADESVPETGSVPLDRAVRDVWSEVDTADADLVVEADATVDAHHGRLDRALENLLRNAVQHGGEDVTVRVGTHPDGFFVADDGPGIPAADRDQVFDSSYSTADRGTGFGLDLVRQAVEAHGWDIEVTESADGGARFEVHGVD
jgi:PAS domain S-box-containing protein